MEGPGFTEDILPGYEKLTLELDPEGDGPLVATLVRPKGAGRSSKAVLYVHGFNDYFFQTHLADAFQKAGYDFYALDLRRYGRSLRPGNNPNQCDRLDDYFHEITWALDYISGTSANLSGFLAHSTGGLTASLYLSRGPRRHLLGCGVLNNPFLDFRANALEKLALVPVAKLGEKLPLASAPVKLDPVYGKTLHKSESGEWDYDLAKKPLAGFGVTCGWIRAVRLAQEEVHSGLSIGCPLLVQASEKWHRPGKEVTERDRVEDIVLCSDHSRQYGPTLGKQVEVQNIRDGIHDLTLSRREVRELVIASQVAFVQNHRLS